jgi:uncharacterized membrane protein YgdD (TMEM256/DUF423 family)
MHGRFWIAAGALLGGAGVTAGAVGTHVLKEVLKLPDSDLAAYETAVRYQMYHALALVMIGLLVGRGASRWLSAAGAAFLAGTLLFSGGLYVWLATGQTAFVQIVPVGGTAWIVGWLLLAAWAISAKRSPAGAIDARE